MYIPSLLLFGRMEYNLIFLEYDLSIMIGDEEIMNYDEGVKPILFTYYSYIRI